MHRARRGLMAAIATSLGLAALVAPGASAATAAPHAPAVQQAPRTVSAIDVGKLQVSYRGKFLTSAQTSSLQAARERGHREFVVVYDPASAAVGIAHAFDSRVSANAYGAKLKTDRVRPAAVRQGGTVTPMSLPSGCPDAKNLSRMYDYTSCGGSNFDFLLTENDPSFTSVGWQNRGSSIVVGWTTSLCTILVRLWPGPTYTYTEADFYGGTSATYYAFGSAINNNAESGKSTCS